MIYKLNNHADSVLDLDIDSIYEFILVKFNIKESTEDEIIESFKAITRDPVQLHEIAVETRVPIHEILKIIVKKRPDLVDKRFLTRMRKLYNTK